MRRAVAALVLAASAAACGGGAEFSAADLRRIVLQPGEAPAGTAYQPDLSGRFSAEEYAADEAEAARLADAGLRAVRVTTFATVGLLEEEGGTPAGARYVESAGLLFDDAEGARAGLEALRRSNARGDYYVAIASEGLGERSFGFSISSLGYPDLQLPGYLFAWARANAVFVHLEAAVLGTIDETQVLDRAGTIDVRARP